MPEIRLKTAESASVQDADSFSSRSGEVSLTTQKDIDGNAEDGGEDGAEEIEHSHCGGQPRTKRERKKRDGGRWQRRKREEKRAQIRTGNSHGECDYSPNHGSEGNESASDAGIGDLTGALTLRVIDGLSNSPDHRSVLHFGLSVRTAVGMSCSTELR